MLARPKVTTFGAGCDPCPGLPRCCASPYCCCRAARAALRTATGNGNRERTRALSPFPWSAGASAAGRLPCLASPFFGGDSKAACRRLASQLAAHSATMGRSAISHGELAALLVDGEASMPSAWLYAPFEQQQSARSSTKPPSPLFADVCTAPPPPAIQSGPSLACAIPSASSGRRKARGRCALTQLQRTDCIPRTASHWWALQREQNTPVHMWPFFSN